MVELIRTIEHTECDSSKPAILLRKSVKGSDVRKDSGVYNIEIY